MNKEELRKDLSKYVLNPTEKEVELASTYIDRGFGIYFISEYINKKRIQNQLTHERIINSKNREA